MIEEKPSADRPPLRIREDREYLIGDTTMRGKDLMNLVKGGLWITRKEYDRAIGSWSEPSRRSRAALALENQKLKARLKHVVDLVRGSMTEDW